MSKDPIGFAGGDVILYGYVKNNPIYLIDPFGLEWEKNGPNWYNYQYKYSKQERADLRRGLDQFGYGTIDMLRIPKRIIENPAKIAEIGFSIACFLIRGCQDPTWHPEWNDLIWPTPAHAAEPPSQSNCK